MELSSLFVVILTHIVSLYKVNQLFFPEIFGYEDHILLIHFVFIILIRCLVYDRHWCSWLSDDLSLFNSFYLMIPYFKILLSGPIHPLEAFPP